MEKIKKFKQFITKENIFYDIDINNVIHKIKNGDLWIVRTGSGDGYFISNDDDSETYVISPYDDNPINGWYIETEGEDSPIMVEYIEKFEELCN